MKAIRWIVIAVWALVGCGAPEFEGADELEVLIETGTAEQATTYQIHNQYGIKASTQGRCQHVPSNFSGDICGMPDDTSRSWSVNWDTGTTLSEVLSSKSAVQDTSYNLRVVNNHTQWEFPKLADNSVSGNIQVYLGCWGLTGGSFARTDNGSFLGSGIRHYNESTILVDTCKIRTRQNAGHPNGSPWTTTEKSRFVYNIVKHEVGHAIGLGHNPAASQCLLMSAVMDPECFSAAAKQLEPDEFNIVGTFRVL